MIKARGTPDLGEGIATPAESIHNKSQRRCILPADNVRQIYPILNDNQTRRKSQTATEDTPTLDPNFEADDLTALT